jgi:hypothetical protein
MLAKSAKLKWGIGHQALKVIYSGAIEPIYIQDYSKFHLPLQTTRRTDN